MNLTKRTWFNLTLMFTLTLFSSVVAQTDHGAADASQHGASHNVQDTNFDEREQAVMPFDVTATLHIFEDTATGGVQRVVANDPDDAENILLIRSHLAEEAARFIEGDFTDPGYLHGEAMPGLAELTAAGARGQLEVSYSDTEEGGQIVFNSSEADVVIALHLWFQAQVTYHGDHATH